MSFAVTFGCEFFAASTTLDKFASLEITSVCAALSIATGADCVSSGRVSLTPLCRVDTSRASLPDCVGSDCTSSFDTAVSSG